MQAFSSLLLDLTDEMPDLSQVSSTSDKLCYIEYLTTFNLICR